MQRKRPKQPPTSALPNVAWVGTGCAATGSPPRLLTPLAPGLGVQTSLDVYDATPSVAAIYALALGGTLPAPVTLFGCDVWINAAAASTSVAIVDPAGQASLPFNVPNNPALSGVQLAAQVGVLSPVLSMTNALGLQL